MQRTATATICFFCLFPLAVSGCSSGQRGKIETVAEFREAREHGDFDRAESLLARDARIWFDDLSGEGNPINLRTGWSAWDREMGAFVRATNLQTVDDTVVGEFHEVNDYSRLLGFDGWWSQITYWFDNRGRIEKQLYVPLADRPSGHDDARAIFTEWAEANRPDEFNAISPIEPGTQTARRWRMLLIDWRRATGQPMPRLPGWEARLKDRVRAFVLAGTWEDFVGQTSPDYQLWFEEKTGDGMGRAELRDIFEWDKAVNSRPEIQRIDVEGDQVHAFVHEENEFTRLIKFGGFNMNVIYRVDRDGRIREQVVVDQGTMAAFGDALKVATDWLEVNRPNELASLYSDGRMDFNGESAKQWMSLLREWRQSTGQPPVE